MKRYFAGSLLLLGFGLSAVAAEDKPERIAKAKAEEIVEATLKGDFGKLLDLTYPEIVARGGGRAKILASMESQMKEWKSKGLEFRSAKVGETAQLITGGNRLFAVVPFTMEMTLPGGKLNGSSFMLGVSADKGKTWTFINGDKVGDDEIKKMLPNLPATLKLPAKQKPIFTRDK